jgi:hypothetical protein
LRAPRCAVWRVSALIIDHPTVENRAELRYLRSTFSIEPRAPADGLHAKLARSHARCLAEIRMLSLRK